MAAQLGQLRNLEYGRNVDPAQVAQAGPAQARDYATLASREVQSMGLPMLFDVTQGRVDSAVRQTPTTQSGSPMVPILNANFQMIRDSTNLGSYVNMGVYGPINGDMPIQDALTLGGTKAANATRDSWALTKPEDATGYVDNIDPITKCAPGEQIMLLRSGQLVQSRPIKEVYGSYQTLANEAELVGVSAGEPQQTFLAAYSQPRQRMMASSVPINQPPTNYASAMSGASFSRTMPQIP